MESVFEYIKNHLVVIIIICSLLSLSLYVIYATTLNKLNRALYKKDTPMAWIPIINIYLLGKLTIHKLFGFVLVIGLVLGSNVTITTDNTSKIYSILPENIQGIYYIIYSGVLVVLFVFACIKLKNTAVEEDIMITDIRKSERLNRPFIDPRMQVKKTQELSNQTNDFSNDSFSNNTNSSTISLKDLSQMNKHNSDSNNSQNP